MIDWSIVASQDRVEFFENPQVAAKELRQRRRDGDEASIFLQGDEVPPFLTFRNTLLAAAQTAKRREI